MATAEMAFGEEFVPLTPIHFFQLQGKLQQRVPGESGTLGKEFRLPNTSGFCREEPFAAVWMGWSQEGITCDVMIKGKAFGHGAYPNVQEGDSIELFIDTRDLKSAGFNTRFCHHFIFLPKEVDGCQAEERTHFRTEDRHDHCSPEDLVIHSLEKNRFQIFIPNHCLFGYDPEQFDRIGMTYRINRWQGEPQHFAVSSSEYQIDQQPALWSSWRLVS